MIYATEAELLADAERLTAIWQPLLFLQEWRIRVVVDTLQDNRGEIEHHWEALVADLRIDRKYWLGRRDGVLTAGEADAWTLEETVIHELLHLRLTPFRRASKGEAEAEENRLVSLLARTLKGLRATHNPAEVTPLDHSDLGVSLSSFLGAST